MEHKEFCIMYLEFFKNFIATHDELHSSLVLANTTHTFEYDLKETETSIELNTWFVFKFKERNIEIKYQYLRMSWDVTPEYNNDIAYKQMLERLTYVLIYGINHFKMSDILLGKVDLNWIEKINDNTIESKTLIELINEVFNIREGNYGTSTVANTND